MPVHNCGEYLHDAMNSILSQTFKEFEFIVINDGSTDNTLEVLKEYGKRDSRIKILDQPNSGIVRALNTGLYEAEGEWIFRMDGDDISLPHRFETQIEAIKKNPSLVLLGGWCQQINSDGIPLKINKYPTTHEGLVSNLESLKAFFPHPSTCFKRNIVLKIGGYRERFRHSEDFDLWLRLYSLGQLDCCKEVVIYLRKHLNSISNQYSRYQKLIGMAALICHFRRNKNLEDPSEKNQSIWNKFLQWLENELEKEGYFSYLQKYEDLGNILYRNCRESKTSVILHLSKKLLFDSMTRKAIFYRFKIRDTALYLTKKSEILF
jgi:glycosyltransferase involved in cell wall biosynthesis